MKKICYLSEHANPAVCQYISRQGYTVKQMKTTTLTYPAIAAHPDIYLCRLGIDGPVFRGDCSRLKPDYPGNIRYNAAYTGKYLIHNLKYTDPDLLQQASESSMELIHVPQGYTKCNTVIVSENAIITSDHGIAKACHNKLDLLLIRPGYVKLTGFPYGFLGGASGRIGDEVIFHGNLAEHPDFTSIATFIRNRNLKLKYFEDFPLEDIGSIL